MQRRRHGNYAGMEIQECAHLLIRGRDLGDDVADSGAQGTGLHTLISSYDHVVEMNVSKQAILLNYIIQSDNTSIIRVWNPFSLDAATIFMVCTKLKSKLDLKTIAKS